MAAYVIDEKIGFKIEQALSNNDLINEVERNQLTTDLSLKYITINSLKIVKKYEIKKDGQNILDLLRGKSLIFPDFKKISNELSEEQLKRRLFLQTKEEERSYNRMIYGSELNPAAQEILTVSNQMSSVKNQLSVGVNMIVVIFATFGMVYYISGQFTNNKSTRMIYGLAASVLMMVLEMVLFIMRAVQMEHACESRSSQELSGKGMMSTPVYANSKKLN